MRAGMSAAVTTTPEVRHVRALLGSDADGRRVLVAEQGRTDLECDWSAKGKPTLDATEFNLFFPPSLVSQLFLRIPAELDVECRLAGVVSRPAVPPDHGATLWQVDLGGRAECRVTIARRPGPATKSDAFFDQETTYLVRTDKLQIQSRLQFDIFSSPLTALSLTVPAHVRVETVSFADDVPLAFAVHPVKDAASRSTWLLRSPFLSARGDRSSSRARRHTRQPGLESPRIDVPSAIRRRPRCRLSPSPIP